MSVRLKCLFAAATGVLFAAGNPLAAERPGAEKLAGVKRPEVLRRIGFGSCARQKRLQPIWESILDKKPDLFILLGDNIYGDTAKMKKLRRRYRKLGNKPGFRILRDTCPVLAIWDDHDYGLNDGGAEFPKKRQSQEIFLDFFREPPGTPRRETPGIYDAHVIGPPGKRVQIILLDTRYFRSPLIRHGADPKPEFGREGSYRPNNDPKATILGATQWEWLEKQLRVEADLRIIASSIQVISEDHNWEKWANFPRERKRLFKLIRDTKAEGVVFISGDLHSAELSRLNGAVDYPLYDITSSPLNQTRDWVNEINRHRLGSNYFHENFGMIRIDWKRDDPLISFRIHSEEGKLLIRHDLGLSRLQIGEKQ